MITSPKILEDLPDLPTLLVKRKPVVQASEGEATINDEAQQEGRARRRVRSREGVGQEGRQGHRGLGDGQRALLEWITILTLDDLRAVQGARPSPGATRSSCRSGRLGVGGVARLVLLAKLDKSMVPDSDDPLRLNKAFRLLPGARCRRLAAARRVPRAPVGTRCPAVRRGEEFVAEAGEPSQMGREPLDAGQRLAPDGSQFNVLPPACVVAMQSAQADRAAKLTLERMLDEFATLTFRSAFFEQTDVGERVLVARARCCDSSSRGLRPPKAAGPTARRRSRVEVRATVHAHGRRADARCCARGASTAA